MTDETLIRTPSGKKMELTIQAVNGVLLPSTFRESIDFANVMSRGGVAVPKHLRENAGACLAIIHSAMAWGIDAWMLARKSYSVNDIIAFEAQVFATVVKLRAPIREKVIPYVFSGQGPTRQCSITLHHAETGEVIEYTSPKVSEVEPKKSPLWKYEPDQALAYWSIRALARRHFAELLMGAYDVDEAYAMRDVTPKATANFLNTTDDPVEGDIVPPKFVAPENAKIKVGDTVDVDLDTGEVAVVPPETIASNMLKYIAAETDPVILQDWQNDNQSDINGLPSTLSKEVISALNKRHEEMDPF